MPPITVRRFLYFLLVSIFVMSMAPIQAAKAQDSSQARKVVRKAMPNYPALARQMNLAGTVKVAAVVAPDGKVKSVEAMGGSPLLIESAKDAILQWKFSPAAAESREIIELHFNP